jgi:hypothetical protein
MNMSISNQKGNALLFTIIGIAMAAAMGMGMFYMTSTTSLGQAVGSGMNRAYYLALAGRDYAIANWNNRTLLNGHEFTLSNTELFSFAATDITNAQITSTGIVNKGSSFEAKKTITSPPPSPVKKFFVESFGDVNLPNWDKSTQVGGFAVTTVSGGGNALQVISAPVAFGSGSWAFLAFNGGAAGVDLTNPWINAGYCLSYDLQVKVNNNQLYYMAGLNFKVDNGIGDNRQFYGISFLRAKQSLGSDWYDNDDIPSELKPPAIWNLPVTIGSDRYSQPAIVLWKRQNGSFSWLAYKILSSSDFVVDGSNNLVPWSNLQVRLIEAYPLNFTSGGPTPLLHNAIIVGATSGARARISGTPIITAGTWSSNSATGTLTLTNVSGTFQSGENLFVNNSIRASGTIGLKTNYIRVYYGDENPHGIPNSSPTDNNRGGDPRVITGSSDIVHWPVDNVSDWQAFYDYTTLVQWDGVNTCPSNCQPSCLPTCTPVPHILGGISSVEPNAIIEDNSLLTPNGGTIDYSGIALHATGYTAVFTQFADFAIQY